MIAYDTKEVGFAGKKLLLSTPKWDTLELSTVIPELMQLLKEEESLIERIASEQPMTYRALHGAFTKTNDHSRRDVERTGGPRPVAGSAWRRGKIGTFGLRTS